jgi:hypothetical protein
MIIMQVLNVYEWEQTQGFTLPRLMLLIAYEIVNNPDLA